MLLKLLELRVNIEDVVGLLEVYPTLELPVDTDDVAGRVVVYPALVVV